MIDRSIGVVTTHNEPSTLTEDEKRLRAKRRSLQRELEIMRRRVGKFEAMLPTASGPVQEATIKAQLQLAAESVERAEIELAQLAKGDVN